MMTPVLMVLFLANSIEDVSRLFENSEKDLKIREPANFYELSHRVLYMSQSCERELKRVSTAEESMKSNERDTSDAIFDQHANISERCHTIKTIIMQLLKDNWELAANSEENRTDCVKIISNKVIE